MVILTFTPDIVKDEVMRVLNTDIKPLIYCLQAHVFLCVYYVCVVFTITLAFQIIYLELIAWMAAFYMCLQRPTF